MPGFQLKATQQQSHKATQQQSHVLSEEQGSLLNFVQEQSFSDVQELLESLEQRGELEFDMVPAVEEDEQLEDADEFDAEWSLDDEDAPSPDESSPATENSEEEPSSQAGAFEIRVVADKTGKVRCIVPENEWATVTPLTNNAEKTLETLRGRYHTLATIAKWLEHEEGDWLAHGVDSFLKSHTLKQQGSFVEKRLGINSGTFSRHIKNAYLSWPDASIPLSILFSKRGDRE